MKDLSTSSEKLSRKGISKAHRALRRSLKIYILSGVFLTFNESMDSINSFINKTYQLKDLFNVDAEYSV